jgi:hypothetical protein
MASSTIYIDHFPVSTVTNPTVNIRPVITRCNYWCNIKNGATGYMGACKQNDVDDDTYYGTCMCNKNNPNMTCRSGTTKIQLS